MRAKTYNVQFRRKRESKTDYKKRVKLLQGGMLRLVIRGSLKNILAQIIKYEAKGDKVIICASSKELEKFGWKVSRSNIPAAYLTGFLLGKKGGKEKFGKMVLDIGLAKLMKGGKLSAALKGCLDGGLDVICSQNIFPSEDKIKGKNIENITPLFEEVKKNIEGGK